MTTYRKEIYRKIFHLSALAIAAGMWLLPSLIAKMLLAIMLAISIEIEHRRRGEGVVSKLFYRFFSPLLREHEHKTLMGVTFMLLSALLVLSVFHKQIAFSAFSIVVVGDLFAALVGKKWGKCKIVGEKTIEGTLAFIVSGLVTVAILGIIVDAAGPFYLGGLAAVIAGALAELVAKSMGTDDNLLAVVASATCMWFVLYYI